MSLWKIDFAVATNEDWVDTIGVVENEGETDETPYDLTGSHLIMQIKTQAEKLTVKLELSTDNGLLIIEDPSTGEPYANKFTVMVPQETVATMAPAVYVYDIVWTRVDGRVVQFIEGTVTVNLGVTRDDP